MKKKKLPLLNEKHEYFVDGFRVPGVSEILQENALCPKYFNSENSAKFGTITHKTLHLLDEGNLHEHDEQLDEYIEGWKNFKADYIKEFLEIEQKFYCDKYYYCGTYDRIAILKDYSIGVVDIKTSNKLEHHYSLQVSGYLIGYNEGIAHKASKGYVVRLDPTLSKKYEVQFITNKDRAVWLSAVTLTHWRKKCNLIKNT